MRNPLPTTLLLTGAIVGSLTLAGCSGGGPLESSLTEVQRDALANAWSQRIEVVGAAPTLDAEKVTARARGLNEACRDLDTSNDFLGAVKESCSPTAAHAKLQAVLAERCVTPSAVCGRAVTRIESANDRVIKALRTLNTAAREITEDQACRGQFITTDAQLVGYEELSRAYGILGLGADRKDADIMQLGRNRINDARVVISRSGDPRQQRLDFLDSCQLAPPGT